MKKKRKELTGAKNRVDLGLLKKGKKIILSALAGGSQHLFHKRTNEQARPSIAERPKKGHPHVECLSWGEGRYKEDVYLRRGLRSEKVAGRMTSSPTAEKAFHFQRKKGDGMQKERIAMLNQRRGNSAK